MKTAGVILAAGRGSRMRELTAEHPKCLVRLAGKPLLEWQVSALRGAGVERLLVVRGYAASCLQGPFETVDNPRWEETNMLASLLCADGFARDVFAHGAERLVVSYSDIVYHTGHVRKLLTCPSDIAITYDTEWESLWSLRFGNPLLDAETFYQENGILKEIGGKPQTLDDIHGQYMGLFCFSPSGWESVTQLCRSLGNAVDKTDMTSFLRLLLAQDTPIGAVPVAGKWCEADSSADLHAYENALAQGNWIHDWR